MNHLHLPFYQLVDLNKCFIQCPHINSHINIRKKSKLSLESSSAVAGCQSINHNVLFKNMDLDVALTFQHLNEIVDVVHGLTPDVLQECVLYIFVTSAQRVNHAQHVTETTQIRFSCALWSLRQSLLAMTDKEV